MYITQVIQLLLVVISNKRFIYLSIYLNWQRFYFTMDFRQFFL